MTHKQRCKGEYTDKELLEEYFRETREPYYSPFIGECHRLTYCTSEREKEIESIVGKSVIEKVRVDRAKERRLLSIEQDLKKVRKKFPKLFR